MCFEILFLIFWFNLPDTSKALTDVKLTLFRTINSMKYTSLSVPPLEITSQIKCAVKCDQSQCCAASYHQQLQECYLLQSCFEKTENANGWKILQKNLVLKTIYNNQTKSWDDSQAHCASLGGRLAVIDTAEKHNLIKDYATKYTWVGASDRDEEGTWVWYNPMQPVMLDYWASEQPNNYLNQHCMTYDPDYFWDDRDCSDLSDFICDIPDIPEKH